MVERGTGIDDVLASVRRLVMVDPAGTRLVRPGLLILTPAQRVATPTEPGLVGESSRPNQPSLPAAEVAPASRSTGDTTAGVTLEDRIAELEAALGRAQAEIGAMQSTATGVGPSDPARVPAGVSAPLAAPHEASKGVLSHHRALPLPRREGDDSIFEEALIEEDSLREIVASLVREELRGELGEHITRGVRRMIRRELQRALALEHLEGSDPN